MQLFTPEDLLLYMYKESSPELTVAIESALKEDWMLREKLQVMQLSLDNSELDKVLVAPRMEVVLRVLNYAKETTTESVHHH